MFAKILRNKSNIYKKDWSKFDQENFILDYFSVDWEDLLKIDVLKADNSTKMYSDKINMLLTKKIKLLTNFINKKDPILKVEFHTKYKKHKNLLFTLAKKSKQAYYDIYFERNWNNIKNTWKGIKSLMSLKL